MEVILYSGLNRDTNSNNINIKCMICFINSLIFNLITVGLRKKPYLFEHFGIILNLKHDVTCLKPSFLKMYSEMSYYTKYNNACMTHFPFPFEDTFSPHNSHNGLVYFNYTMYILTKIIGEIYQVSTKILLIKI